MHVIGCFSIFEELRVAMIVSCPAFSRRRNPEIRFLESKSGKWDLEIEILEIEPWNWIADNGFLKEYSWYRFPVIDILKLVS
jgi:hypothetical protein